MQEAAKRYIDPPILFWTAFFLKLNGTDFWEYGQELVLTYFPLLEASPFRLPKVVEYGATSLSEEAGQTLSESVWEESEVDWRTFVRWRQNRRL